MGFESIDELLEMELATSEDDGRPTPHGRHLTRAMAARNLVRGKRVLELGGGVGNQTVLLVRQGARHVVAATLRPFTPPAGAHTP